MDTYQLAASNTVLLPLDTDNMNCLRELAARESFRQSSLLYPSPYNVSYSCRPLMDRISEPAFPDYNRLYVIKETEPQQLLGITGLSAIDWRQRRAELILLLDAGFRKAKKHYVPLKLILRQGVGEWGLQRLFITVFADDEATATVLKGFGLVKEGEAKEFGRIGKEEFAVACYGLKAREFHYVDG